MNEHFLVFSLEGQRCALPLKRVERVLRAVEITPVPGGKLPSAVRGVVNVHGEVMPVFDVRIARSKQQVSENEQMILIVLNDEHRALLLCDEVEGVQQVTRDEIASPRALLPDAQGNGDVLNLAGELVPVSDLDALLEAIAGSSAWLQPAEVSSDSMAAEVPATDGVPTT